MPIDEGHAVPKSASGPRLAIIFGCARRIQAEERELAKLGKQKQGRPLKPGGGALGGVALSAQDCRHV
jgi:hypothetical protein